MRITNAAFTVLNVLVWGSLTWVGIDLTSNVASRTGYSNAVQITHYVHFPATMLLCSLVVCTLALLTKYIRTGLILEVLLWIGLTLQLLILIVALPFFASYGGGV